MSEINFINLLGSTCTVLHIYLLSLDLEILNQGEEKSDEMRGFPIFLAGKGGVDKAALCGGISPR